MLAIREAHPLYISPERRREVAWFVVAALLNLDLLPSPPGNVWETPSGTILTEYDIMGLAKTLGVR